MPPALCPALLSLMFLAFAAGSPPALAKRPAAAPPASPLAATSATPLPPFLSLFAANPAPLNMTPLDMTSLNMTPLDITPLNMTSLNMTPVDASSIKEAARLLRDARRRNAAMDAAAKALANRPLTGPSEWYAFGEGNLAPAAHEAGGVAFDGLAREATDAGAAGILRRLIAEHDAAKPPGWGKLVERVKRARDAGGEKEMARVADALINETPYVDHTNGVYFSPKRFFERGGAVCKDYVNVKYLLLRDAGFPVERMRVAAFAPSANSAFSEGHVALLVKIDAEAEPYALDLTPAHLFNKDLQAAGETKAQRMTRMKKEGLGSAPEPRFGLGNMVPLRAFNNTAYGRYRGLLATSNEVGSRYFARKRPSTTPEEQRWVGPDGQTTAYQSKDGIWVMGLVQGQGKPFTRYKLMGPRELEQEKILLAKKSSPPRG